MSGKRALITCRQMQGVIDHFRNRFVAAGVEIEMPTIVQRPSETELIDWLGDFDGIIAGDDPLTAPVLERAGRLRIISKWGVGTDAIDKAAARRLGIAVTNTPNVFGEEVADLALGYVIMLARQLHRIDASVRDGGWLKVEGRSLAGSTVGVVGLGDIGLATARRAHGFSMRVVGSDPSDAARTAAQELGVETAELRAVIAASDYLVLCCPLTASNLHLIDADALAGMPAGSSVVNVARGALVDQVSLVESLRSGHTRAAALDVFEVEPLADGSPLREFPQCVFGSHNGSNTAEANLRASAAAVDNLLEALA